MVWVAFREGDKRRRRAMTVATVDGRVTRTLVDLVQVIFHELYENPEFRNLLSATTSEESENGSLLVDDALASIMIRDRAWCLSDQETAERVRRAKLKEITMALRIVMGRYGIGRLQRRYKDRDQGPEGSSE
jgi:F0F1-type ATP synthase beta subunit